MATFLDLCQRVAGESGMAGSGYATPTTVVGQTGDEGQFVKWTADAWRRIQTFRVDWLWMQAEFAGPTVASQQRYSAASDFSLTRFAGWVHWSDEGYDSGLSAYLTASGQVDEGPLIFCRWGNFYQHRLRGAAATTEGRPSEVAVDPAQKLCLFPIPDAVYTVRGQYRKSPQELTADSDEPEMPARFHDLIWMGALLRVGSNQEAAEQYPIWRDDYQRLMGELIREQTPQVWSEALA